MASIKDHKALRRWQRRQAQRPAPIRQANEALLRAAKQVSTLPAEPPVAVVPPELAYWAANSARFAYGNFGTYWCRACDVRLHPRLDHIRIDSSHLWGCQVCPICQPAEYRKYKGTTQWLKRHTRLLEEAPAQRAAREAARRNGVLWMGDDITGIAHAYAYCWQAGR